MPLFNALYKSLLLLLLLSLLLYLFASDLDECASDETNSCIPGTTCDNLIGSYICLCPDGYELQDTETFGTLCLDIDECTDTSTNDCDVNAACVNTDGGFMCFCKEENHYVGDGQTCTCESYSLT